MRAPFFATCFTGLLLMVSAWLWIDTSFRPLDEIALQDSIEAPINMETLPQVLGKTLDQKTFGQYHDRWGFTYPISEEVTIPQRITRHHVAALNSGIRQYNKGRAGAAKASWAQYYGVYPDWVTGRDVRGGDRLPTSSENELVLYGLMRYNRATATLEMLHHYRPGDVKIKKGLTQSLYDYRRSVASFQTLAEGSSARRAYWNGLPAWEGLYLKEEHAQFPIFHVYHNLAINYLRLGDQKGYPETSVAYMRRQSGKYKDDMSSLSGITSYMTQSCVNDGRKLGREKYRLVMALQNLEASSRGLGSSHEPRFHYTTGLILTQLAHLDGKANFDEAIAHLNLATKTKNSADSEIVHAAYRELALIYLQLNDKERFAQAMEKIDPNAIAASAAGPYREQNLLFADLACFATLANGNIEAFRQFQKQRQNAYREGDLGEETVDAHQKINNALGQAFGHGLKAQLSTMIRSGRGDEAGRIIYQMKTQLKEHPHFYQGYQKTCEHKFANRLAANQWLYDHQQLFAKIKWVPPILLAILFVYLLWFVISHVKVGKRMLNSQYGEDSPRG